MNVLAAFTVHHHTNSRYFLIPLLALALFTGALLAPKPSATIPRAQADILACPYPGVMRLIEVSVIGTGKGYSCWFPREINNSNWRCYLGSGGIGGGIASTPTNAFPVLGMQGMTFGGTVADCSFLCPNGFEAETPNPTGLWGREGVPADTKYKKCPDKGHPPGEPPHILPYAILRPEDLPPDDESGGPEAAVPEPDNSIAGNDRAAQTNPDQPNPNNQVDTKP